MNKVSDFLIFIDQLGGVKNIRKIFAINNEIFIEIESEKLLYTKYILFPCLKQEWINGFLLKIFTFFDATEWSKEINIFLNNKKIDNG